MESGYHTTHDGTRIHYRIDDFTDGWKSPESVLLIHGLAESTEAWNAWVPHLARDFRVIRFDMRGFGKSTVMPADHCWSAAEIYRDIQGLLAFLGVEKVNVIGCKSGGTLALGYACMHPGSVSRLAVVGSNPRGPRETWLDHIESHGVESWLRQTMPKRLASLSPEAWEWWIDLMGKTPLSTLQGYLRWIPTVNWTDQIASIHSPTLVVVAKNNPAHKVDEIEAWQKFIPNSELKVLPVDCSHVGGAYPDQCAGMVVEFLKSTKLQESLA